MASTGAVEPIEGQPVRLFFWSQRFLYIVLLACARGGSTKKIVLSAGLHLRQGTSVARPRGGRGHDPGKLAVALEDVRDIIVVKKGIIAWEGMKTG